MDFNMFAPQLSVKNSAQKTPTGVISRLTQPIPYYTFATKPSPDEVLDVALMCALCCTSEYTGLTKWKSLLLTYTNTLFGGLVNKIPSDHIRPIPFDADQLSHLASLRKSMMLTEDNSADESTNPLTAEFAGSFIVGDILPAPMTPLNVGWLSYSRSDKILCAHFSIVVFLAGKQINDKNVTSVTVNRPRALIEKYKIDVTSILTGDAKISSNGHRMINQAWLEMTSLKTVCFKEFANYTQQDTDLQQDVIYTTVTLMRFMQMQHASLIYKFILAYPWVRDYAPLRKYITTFDNSLIAANAVEPHLQPFIKLMYGDKSGIFPRKELLPLIACALASEEETTDTLASYYHDSSFSSVVEMFKEERDRISLASRQIGGEKPADAHNHTTREDGTGARADDTQPNPDTMQTDTVL